MTLSVQVRTLGCCLSPRLYNSWIKSDEVSCSVQGKVPSVIFVEGKACTPIARKETYTVKVFVVSKDNQPLMPTTPRRARLWLREKLARIVSLTPFTIRLRFEPSGRYTQPAVVGVDTGSKIVGVAAISNGEVIYEAEVSLRDNIKSKLDQRRVYRRSRRKRKTRYRPPRFSNRVNAKRSGWLPPSLRSKAEATVKIVSRLAAILPVSRIKVEVGSFDTQKMQNPEISGVEYMQGELAGYELREYILTKWDHKCAYCGIKNVPFQIEHIVPKIRGGTNRVGNLTLACKPCNQAKGNRTALEFGYPRVACIAQMPMKDAAHISIIKVPIIKMLSDLFGQQNVSITYGYETKYKRIQILGFPKTHANDAIAIACEYGKVVIPNTVCYQIKCVSRGNYQLYNGRRGEHKMSAPKKVGGWKMYELVKSKGLIGYIGGRRMHGNFVVKDLVTEKLLLEVTPKKMIRLARPIHGWIIQARLAQERKEVCALPVAKERQSQRT